jgi:hypothetical protein
MPLRRKCVSAPKPDSADLPPVAADHLDAEIASVEAQLVRTDAKAALLLGLAGAAATAGPVVVAGLKLHLPAVLAAWAAVAAFATAAAALALTVRPVIGTRSQTAHGPVRFANESAEQILQELSEVRNPQLRARRLSDLSALVMVKYRRIRIAVDGMLCGLALGVLAALLAMLFER